MSTRTITVITRHVLEYDGTTGTADDIVGLWFYKRRSTPELPIEYSGLPVTHAGSVVVSVNEIPARRAA